MLSLATAAAAPSVFEMLEEYQVEAVVYAKARQIKTNVASVRSLCFFGRISQVKDITTRAVQSYIAHMLRCGKSRKTVCNHASNLSAFCRFLVERGLLRSNPISDVALPEPEDPPMLYLTHHEKIQALRLAVENRIFCEVGLALNTGLRREELRMLKWCYVDFDGRVIQIVNAKNKRLRSVSINKRAMAILRRMQKVTGHRAYVFASLMTSPKRLDRPRGNNWWNRALAPLQEKIGKFQQVPEGNTGAGWHMFRHTYATECLRAGMNILELQKELGHSDLKMVKRYAHVGAGYNPAIERI